MKLFKKLFKKDKSILYLIQFPETEQYIIETVVNTIQKDNIDLSSMTSKSLIINLYKKQYYCTIDPFTLAYKNMIRLIINDDVIDIERVIDEWPNSDLTLEQINNFKITWEIINYIERDY